jgi:hypothetical protein
LKTINCTAYLAYDSGCGGLFVKVLKSPSCGANQW